MPALFRIVNDEHPPLPEGASPAVRDFLLQCFQKDPNFRVSARKLLKHPWIAGINAKKPTKTTEDLGATTKFEDAVRSVQQWNEAIKSPVAVQGEVKFSSTNSTQRTNLRAGMVGGVSMTPPKHRESVIDKQIAGKTDPFRSPEGSSNSVNFRINIVDNNWDEFFTFDGKSPELPAVQRATPKRQSLVASTRKPTPISPAHRRRSNLRDNVIPTPSTTDDDDWDKDFEGGLTLKSPKASTHLPPLPPLSPKKVPTSPRKLSPPKSSAGNLSDDNSKTIRPTLSRQSQSRKVSADSNVSSNGNTVRAVSVPSPTRTKSTSSKSNSHERKKIKSRVASREEHSDDGYDDLIKDNETKFAMKINSLKVYLSGI
jgi:hypothetical protein